MSVLNHRVDHVVDGLLRRAEVDSQHFLGLCVIENSLEVPILYDSCRLLVEVAEKFDRAVLSFCECNVVAHWPVLFVKDLSDFTDPERATRDDEALALGFISL